MEYCTYVGIHTESAHEVPVLKKVRRIKGVEEAFRVQGKWRWYDIIAKMKTDNKAELTKIVAEEIKGIRSVQGAYTLLGEC